MKYLSTFVLFLGLVLAVPALALDLQQARSTGVVGEQTDGYIAAVQPSAEANALVASVNAERKAEYARISKTNSQPVDVVAKLAAAEIISKLPPGSFYQDNSGSWKKH